MCVWTIFLFVTLASFGHALPGFNTSTIQRPMAITDHASLLLKVQNYLLQLQSISADHKDALRNIQDWVKDLKVTDQCLRYNLTQQGLEIDNIAKEKQVSLAGVQQKAGNFTTLIRDLGAAIAELKNETSAQEVSIQTVRAKLDAFTRNITSLKAASDYQNQRENNQDRQIKIMDLALQHQFTLFHKLDEKNSALTSSVSNMTMSLTIYAQSLKAIQNTVNQMNSSFRNQQNFQNHQIKQTELLIANQQGEIAAMKSNFAKMMQMHGFTQNKSSFYKFMSTTATWGEAESLCQRQHPDAHLVTVENADENSFIRGLTTKNRVTRGRVWLGGSDVNQENQWEWWNGKAITYTKWHPGQPDDYRGEDCIQMLEDEDTWNDIECGTKCPFVCEISSA